jgi:four helix bundle protein
VIGRQLAKCGTSVGANYRAACRAKSQADFIAKMGIVEEEADESIYWMELLVESELIRKEQIEGLMDEADQLVSIFVSSINTARENKRSSNKRDENQ